MVWSDGTLNTFHGCVDKFTAANVNPASYDLTLGGTLRRVHPVWVNLVLSDIFRMKDGDFLPRYIEQYLTDDDWHQYNDGGCKIDALPRWGAVEEFTETWIMPGEFVLCHSAETITVPNDCVALLFSKSSTGRNGLEHSHAGVADPGFSGQWTWELSNIAPWPVKLVAGQRLMQHVILALDEAAQIPYASKGRYQGQQGPTPARAEVR